MTVWIDRKYLGLVSGRLERFKQSSSTQWIARCPYCGDSKKSKTKARFYIYEKEGTLLTHCFNCGTSSNIRGLLEHLDPVLKNEFICETIMEKNGGRRAVAKEEPAKLVFKKPVTNLGLKKISQLPLDHKARRYIDGRGIPSNWHHRILYAPRFIEWARTHFPDKFEGEQKDHDRIIISFVKDDKVHAVQARAFDDRHGPKYYALVLDDTVPKVFGLERHDPKKLTYVVEGPFDSMFLPNALAACSSDLRSILPMVDKHVLVFDNEPRNPQIVRLIEKALDKDATVCIWPPEWEYKDINEAIEGGISADKIRDTIDANTVEGLGARLRLGNWRRDK